MGKSQLGLWNAFRAISLVGATGVLLGPGFIVFAIIRVTHGAAPGATLSGGLFFGLLFILFGCVSIARLRALSRSGPMEQDEN
jgi:hypothetical protein